MPPRPTRGPNDAHSSPDQRTVIPPGRTLLPEPDTGGLVDDDPLTSPRFSRDGRAERALRSGGYQGDWLSGGQSVTRPMSSPRRSVTPDEQGLAGPGQTGPSSQPGPRFLPKRTPRSAQTEPAERADAGSADAAQAAPLAPAAPETASASRVKRQAEPMRATGQAGHDPAAAQAADGQQNSGSSQAGPHPPVPAQAGPADARSTERGPSLTGPADSAAAVPAPAVPAPAVPAPAVPARPCQLRSCQLRSCQLRSCQHCGSPSCRGALLADGHLGPRPADRPRPTKRACGQCGSRSPRTAPSRMWILPPRRPFTTRAPR